MNKELINKYKPEFDHWLNGGSVLLGIRDLVKSTIKWYPSVTDPFEEESTSGELLIIINDEYLPYKKALSEGKSVQHLVWGEWEDLTPMFVFILPVDCYRIKPDESKFKVGDFVTPLNREINCSVWQIDNILSCNTLVSGNTMLDPRTIKPWTPVKNEWCWFYDSKSNEYSNLAQFKEPSEEYFKTNTGTYWKFCEPFLNSRPSYLKDK